MRPQKYPTPEKCASDIAYSMPPDTVTTMETRAGWLNCFPKKYLSPKATPNVDSVRNTTTVSTVKYFNAIMLTIIGNSQANITPVHSLAF